MSKTRRFSGVFICLKFEGMSETRRFFRGIHLAQVRTDVEISTIPLGIHLAQIRADVGNSTVSPGYPLGSASDLCREFDGFSGVSTYFSFELMSETQRFSWGIHLSQV